MDKKKIIMPLLILILSFSVFGAYPAIFSSEMVTRDLAQYDTVQAEMFYEDVWNAFDAGNLTYSTALNLVGYSQLGLTVVQDEFENEKLASYSVGELETLIDIVNDNTYTGGLTADTIESYLIAKQNSITAKNNEYLEYQSVKNVKKENINSMWLLIVSLGQIILELLNVAIYLISVYLIVYVIMDVIPNAFVFMRDKILEFALKKGGKN